MTIDYDPATHLLRAGVTGPVEVTIHYDPATRWLREAGITEPVDEAGVAWGKPVVFRDEQETND